MRVSLDIDDALFPFMGPFLGFANRRWGTTILPEQVTDYDLAKFKPVEEIWELIDEFSKSEMLQCLVPLPGTVIGVYALQKAGIDLVAVTGRPEKARPETLEQMQRYFPTMPVYFMNQYRGPKKTKEEVCKNLGVDVHVDDQVIQVNAVIGCGLKGIFIPNSWGFTTELHQQAVVARNWQHIVTEILALQ